MVKERHLPGIYDVTMLGYNYRMNELQAALGIEQIKKLPRFLKTRSTNALHLRKRLNECNAVTLLSDTVAGGIASNYCVTALLNEQLAPKREALVTKLKAQGVGTSVYYPRPVPHLDYYQNKYTLPIENFSNAAQISYGSIALPVGPHLSPEDIDYVADVIIEVIPEVLSS